MEEYDCLVDIFDDINPDDLVYCKEEFTEYILELMDEYITKNPKAVTEPDFHENFIGNVQDLVNVQFSHGLWENERFEMDEAIEETSHLFYESIMPERSQEESIIVNQLTPQKIKKLQKHIEYLQSIPQPEQRTKEWYEFRHTLITASAAYKAFESEATKNQLIWEKCQPLMITESPSLDKHITLDMSDSNNCNSKTILFTPNVSSFAPSFVPSFVQVNVNTPMHWGQKYEPVSVMIYEDMYNTKVGEFGCIPHAKYKFLGASPDGINIDPTNERFGRMLEIKNIVNREIDGIPKTEYWIQMQLQMEVCGLDECDFLETKFTEYESGEEYWAHTCNNDNVNNDNDVKQENRIGIIMYFTNPHKYEYCPLDIATNKELFGKWEEEKMEENKDKLWIKNCYWRADIVSCVLVERNRRWFEDNIAELEYVWRIVERERVTGYEHRAPNRRTSSFSNKSKKNVTGSPLQNSGCLLKINKETGQAGLMTKQDHVAKLYGYGYGDTP